MIEPHYLAQHPPATIYLDNLDELHFVSTAAVTCGSNALENQHSTYLRSTEQDVLFKQLQVSNPKRKRDAYRRRVKTSESLKCQLTSCEKNQNTECQSEYNRNEARLTRRVSLMQIYARQRRPVWQSSKENRSFWMHMV